MKISLNWLKDYLDLPMAPEKIGEILTDIGLELESMERVERIPGGLEGVVVGHVLECMRHPNADKLSLTRVDIGAGATLQIVCGAPNVAQGQKVLVATVGTTLHPVEGEPLTLKKGKIRGEDSEGMICAQDELGLGHDHSGILVLPPDAPVGLPAKAWFDLKEDYLFEIGLTPNRSDATSHLGVARDLAAALKTNYSHPGTLCVPDVSVFTVDNHDLPVQVVVENTEACPRYCGVSISGVRVGESPQWLVERLNVIGVRSINNVVDATNYVLNELGQPLHAFDLDQIGGRKVVVKTLPHETRFRALDDTERVLHEEDLMICDGESRGMCIGGVFGGLHSGVKDDTVNIFLEAAHFNPRYIRRTSMRHNLRTDAARIFEKGSDPNIARYALQRAALLIQQLAGGKIASDIVDIYPHPVQPRRIALRYAHVNQLIGAFLEPREIESILEALNMGVQRVSSEEMLVSVPTDKADVTRPTDLIEEILRIYGFNKVAIPDKFSYTLNLKPQPDPSDMRNVVANFLAASGFNEMMALSLSQSRYYRNPLLGVAEEELAYIHNTSNAHLDVMRPDMLVSGLETVLHNQNRQQNRLRLFEFGKKYRKTESGYAETGQLALFLCGDRWKESWLADKKAQTGFFTLKAYVSQILQRTGIEGTQEKSLSHTAFSYGLQLQRGPQVLVELGKINGMLTREMGIRGEVFAAVFNWDLLLQAMGKQRIRYAEVPRFPNTRRDLALVVDQSVHFSEMAAIARKVGKKWIREVNLFDVYENESQLGSGKRSCALSYVFENPERTLQDKEVDEIMDQLIREYEMKLNAAIRR